MPEHRHYQQTSCDKRQFHRIFQLRLNDQFFQSIGGDITSSVRFRVLSTVKNAFEMSPYITKIRNPRVRLLYTRLRIAFHCLATCKTKARLSSDISCPLCKQSDETVEHFLLTCGHFAANRNDFYTDLDASVSLFESLDETDKLRYILDLQCPEGTVSICCKFVSKMYQLRLTQSL